MGLVGSGPSPTPVIPIGGTYEDPTIIITSTCPSFGLFVFDIRFYPTDLDVTEWGTSAAVRDLGGAWQDAGWIRDTLEINPYTTPIEYMVCYGNPNTLSNPCEYFSITLAGCPAFQPSFLLSSITCQPDNSVEFAIEGSTAMIVSATACLGDENCGGPGHISYTYEPFLDPTHLVFVGQPPTMDLPLRICMRVPGSTPDGTEYCGVINDFRSQVIASCSLVAPEPTNTSLAPAVPVPTCADLITYDSCKMLGGCYWWTNSTCHSDSEPLSLDCSTYTAGLECGNAGCYWWGASCHPDTDPCHKYDGDENGCGEASCWYDTKNYTCNTP